MIDDHLAQPGPLYWDFRCLACDQNVSEHAGLIRYLWRRLQRKSRT